MTCRPPSTGPIKSTCVAVLLAIAVVIGHPVSARLQVRAEYDVGALGLLQSLQRLQTTASVMHTGAHPDDEDSALIARLARGDYARVAYLSLNRGEGGQNTIGPELFEPLGVIRTEELLQARRLDGGEQLFTRAFDFGFSRTRAESAKVWGEEPLLEDMVRAIRTFRPLIVISRFSGTPADGHGHHQLAGYLTPIAVARAADPTAFPAQLAEGLRPWRTLKVYVSEGFQPSADQAGEAPLLRIDTGRFDPLLGRSYFEIAMEGRSQHRSQHQGALELRGPRTSGVRLLSSVVNGASTTTASDSVFSGIDTTIAGIAQLAGAPAGTLRADLGTLQLAVDRALGAYRPFAPGEVVPPLADGLQAVRLAQEHVKALTLDSAIKAELEFRLARKASEFEDALTRAAGLTIDPLADRETVAPDETLTVTVRSFYAAGLGVDIGGVQLHAPPGWRVETSEATTTTRDGAGGRGGENAQHTAAFRVTIPADASPTEPYWMTTPRKGALFEWPAGSPKGQPFSPALLEAVVTARIGGADLTLTRGVEFRFADPARGELRRRIDVVPALSVAVNDPLMIVPATPRRTDREVVVRVENLVPAPIKGSLSLWVPAGWTVRPVQQSLSLDTAGDRMSAPFTVTIPSSISAGDYQLEAIATAGDQRYAQTLHTIGYPHIQTHRYYTPAVANVRVLNLHVPAVRVGYIMGTGDDVASAIKLMGLPVTLLDSEALTSGDLSRFDTIVVGIRASEVRPDFIANHKRLLHWVESGGTLIVQYQAPDYAERGLPPYPARISPPTNDARVTDEHAPVSILVPQHPVFTTPNRIREDDWSGWVQERSVNDWTTFDPRYTALLESHDPGEGPQRGGEAVAQLGRGYYVYTAYAWFRQLPAGVPGAYRLFANLLALGQQHRNQAQTRPMEKP
jgi:LmbE family N-acetylglucosaminyl deacetylase